jgi:MFS family permease
MMTNQPQSKYKWYILTLGILTHIFSASMSRMSMPVLFPEISQDLGLNLVQIGVVWGIASLAGLFVAIPAGLISDKYGVTRTLAAACLLQGIAGALRGVSVGFTSLTTFMLLYGLLSVPMSMTTHQAAGQWFSGRQLGFANGVLAMGMGVGFTLASMFSATVLAPLFGGWRHLMFVYGAIAIIISLLWAKARRSPGQSEVAQSIVKVPFRQAFSHVIRIRSLWIIGVSYLCITGSYNGIIGYLPLYLRSIGWTAVSADGTLAALSLMSVVGVVPLSMLSDRLGLRKAIIIPAFILAIIGGSLLSIFTGPIVWLSVILIGFVREGIFAILITMTMETKGVGAAYTGTALGIGMSLAYFGAFLAPPIGNRLAVIDPSFAFIFWVALAVVGLLIFSFMEETGWRKRGLRPVGEAPRI